MAKGALSGFRLGPILGIGVGGLAIAAIWSLYNTFMPLLLGEFISSRSLRGFIMGLDNALAVLLMPLIGAWSDRLGGPLGKRLPFLIFGMPLAALMFALLPFSAAAIWTLLLADIAFLLSMMSFRAPMVALMPDHVAPPARATANGVITLLGALGGALALLALAPLYDEVRWLPFAGAGLILLLSLVAILRTAERWPTHVEQGAASEETPFVTSLIGRLRRIFSRESLGGGLVLCSLFAFFFGYSALEAQFSTFATESLGVSAGRAGSLLGLTLATFMLTALPAGLLASRIGEFRVMTMGALPLALVAISLALVDDPRAAPYLLALAGVFWALIVVPAYPLVVSLGGAASTGFLTGAYYLFGSGAAIVGPGLAGALMDLFGNRALFIAVAVAVAAGAVVLNSARPLVRAATAAPGE